MASPGPWRHSEEAHGRLEQSRRLLREAKSELRTALLTRRSVRTPEERRTADAGRLTALTELFAPAIAAGRLGMVAAYLSAPDEPDTLELVAWLAAQSVPVLLPATSTPAQPDWALYAGPDRLRTGRHGLLEPDTPPLGADGLAAATVIVCPALAATADGIRLGRGGGWYDRALTHARPDAVTAALIDDDELLGSLPAEPHDRPVDMVITHTRVIGPG